MKKENEKMATSNEWDLIKLTTIFSSYHPCTGISILDEEQEDKIKKLYLEGLSLFSFSLDFKTMPDFLLLINQAFEPCLNEEKCKADFIKKKELLKKVQSISEALKNELEKEDDKFIYQFMLDCIVLAQISKNTDKDKILENLRDIFDIDKADFDELKNVIVAIQEKDDETIKEFKLLGLDYLAYLGKFFQVEDIDFKEHSWLLDKSEEDYQNIFSKTQSLSDALKESYLALDTKEKTLIAGGLGLIGVGILYGAKKIFGSNS